MSGLVGDRRKGRKGGIIVFNGTGLNRAAIVITLTWALPTADAKNDMLHGSNTHSRQILS